MCERSLLPEFFPQPQPLEISSSLGHAIATCTIFQSHKKEKRERVGSDSKNILKKKKNNNVSFFFKKSVWVSIQKKKGKEKEKKPSLQLSVLLTGRVEVEMEGNRNPQSCNEKETLIPAPVQ